MKVLVFGARGFIGSAVVGELEERYEVFCAIHTQPNNLNEVNVDLEDRKTIADALSTVQPDVLINCAGVVDAASDISLNKVFTENILTEALASKLNFHRIVVTGSASEYGVVNDAQAPVTETTPLNPISPYAVSKVNEVKVALRYKNEHHLPVVIARIFNPIGRQMQSKFLISRIIMQLEEYKQGTRTTLEIGRLDALRDYVSVKDVASAIRAIIEGRPTYDVYNVGSGAASSNGELMELVIKHSKILDRPVINETSSEKEPPYAACADISRMEHDFEWSPRVTLEDSIKEILNDTRN